ncbi:protease inhibitor I42 family protein [Methanosarcina sp.]|uniref:protease inhibitor I42 family protein n=1 Tax=Methanosarcina sp. TaxID=2213 RepID=UPI002ABD082A|nr:protease inhibitor I42 family protein [Methanosarcina sp.]MDY9927691.1 protease inhibitor I42 family protein [Methanosarcina sp.]
MKEKINGKPVINHKSVKAVRLMAVLFVIFTVSLSGCIDDGQNNTDNETEEPADGQNTSNEEYTYGMANVESIDILTLESFPVQIHVIAEGYLPDGCTEIDEINTEKEGNTFNVNITTKRPKEAICTQAIEDFKETIPLDVQGLSAGNYTVNVNGVIGSFELAVDNTFEEPPSPMPPRQQVVTEANNGTTISLEKGETFYLRLQENPSTGYSWELNLSHGLNTTGNTTDTSGTYYPPESKEGEQPLVGAGGVHLWEIRADSEGSQQVNAIYKRSWENETGTEDRFTLSVEVV